MHWTTQVTRSTAYALRMVYYRVPDLALGHGGEDEGGRDVVRRAREEPLAVDAVGDDDRRPAKLLPQSRPVVACRTAQQRVAPSHKAVDSSRQYDVPHTWGMLYWTSHCLET